MSREEVKTILTNVDKHEIKGVFHRPQINWADAFFLAMDISRKHTEKTGSRSLDIMHVATALTIGADRFLTLDERQSKLALIAGLRLENCVK